MKQSTALARWVRSLGAEEILSAMADLNCEAMFVVDSERNVLLWNKAAESLLGFKARDVVGQSCRESNRCNQCMVGCGLQEQRELKDVPLTLYNDDGQPIAVRKTARAFFADDGSFAGGIEVLAADLEAHSQSHPSPPESTDFYGLVTRSDEMFKIHDVIRNVAETEATILVRGESGTGKELVARAIHQVSHRASGPFVAINCAALSPALLESELFGHVKGAFTGAIRDKEGLFARASGGTLFLDEVGELSLELQAKLLRVLEERTVTPVGGSNSIGVDVRVVSATHRALRQEVKAGRFREDLMFRLRVVPIFLPPLRERRTDVEILLWHFIASFNEKGPRLVRTISPDAVRTLLDYSWPGNVRELRNVVEYAFAVGRGTEIKLDDLPPEFREGERRVTTPTPTPRGDSEPERLRNALDQAGGHIGRAAAILGVSRPTFWRMRKKHEV